MALSKVGKKQVDQSASLTVDGDLTVDTTTLHVDSTNNRVGVGTNSPTQALTVNGQMLSIASSGASFKNITPTTANNYMWLGNTGNNLYVGKESSAGGTLFVGSSAYAAVIGNDGAYSLQFATNNNVRATIDSSGRVTMPYQPFFHGYWQGVLKAAGWAYPNSNPASLINRGNHYNSSTGQFTCPVAGDYEIRCGGFILTAGNGERVGISFDRNGGGYVIGGGQLSTGDTPFPWNSVIIPASANDTLRVGSFYSPNGITLGNSSVFYSFGVQIRLIS